MQVSYSEIIAKNMKFVYSELFEKGCRLFAGLEAQRLERGGQQCITDWLGCSGGV